MKKIFSIILTSLLIIISICPVLATEKNKNTNYNEEIQIGIFNRQEKRKSKIQSYSLVKTGTISAHLIRSGNTKNVDVILSWNGDFPINAIRFKKLTITNGAILNPKTYVTISPKNTRYLTYNASSYTYHLYKTIKRVSIPISVKKATVKATDLQVYYKDFGWLSGVLKSGNITIK